MIRSRAIPRTLLLLLGLALLTGCAARKRRIKEPDLRPVVTKVKIEGAKELKPNKIRLKLAQQPTHPLHWVPILNFVFPRVHLDGTAWEEDKTRISNIYALNGFFDARVVAAQTQVRKLRKDGTTPKFVWIVHQLEEGEASFVRDVVVAIDRTDGGPERTPMQQEELRQALSDGLRTRTGDRFSMSAVDSSRKVIRARLADRAYARARVEARVDAFPEEHMVDVRFDVRPGAPAVFGEVRIHGLTDVKERYVERHIRIEPGQPWNRSTVRQTQKAIYDMGVFALVTVGPDLEGEVELLEDGTEVVPVDIFLKERKPQSFEGGGGIGFTSGSFDAHGRLAYSHMNLGKRLVRFDVDFEGGFVYLGTEDFGPGGHLTVGLQFPDWPHRTIDLFVSGGIETDVQRGYKYFSPEGEAGITWSPVRGLRFTLSYGVSYFGLYDNRLDALDLAAAGASEGIALDDGYFLTVLREEIVLDLRDNLLAPNRGLFASATVDEALPPGGFGYIKVIGDLRGYIPLGTPRLVLAARGVGSYIHTFEQESQVPIQEAIFAGGDGSVRGWKPRYLGPRTVEESCERRDCIIPLGGKVGFTGSLELRGKVYDGGSFGVWGAAFSDVGRVWGEKEEIDSAATFFEDLQVSLGGGIRLDIGAIGRLRLDFAIHPRPWTDDVFRQRMIKPRFCTETLAECPEDLRLEPANWSIHFGIGESF